MTQRFWKRYVFKNYPPPVRCCICRKKISANDVPKRRRAALMAQRSLEEKVRVWYQFMPFPLRIDCGRHTRPLIFISNSKRPLLPVFADGKLNLRKWYRRYWCFSYHASRKLAKAEVYPWNLINLTKRKLIELLGNVSALKVWRFLRMLKAHQNYRTRFSISSV